VSLFRQREHGFDRHRVTAAQEAQSTRWLEVDTVLRHIIEAPDHQPGLLEFTIRASHSNRV